MSNFNDEDWFEKDFKNDSAPDPWGSSDFDNGHDDGVSSGGFPRPPRWSLYAAAGVACVVVLAFAVPSVMNAIKSRTNPPSANSASRSSTPSVTPSATPSSTVTTDPYSQPTDMQALIAGARTSTATVYCGNWSGSGFAVDLPPAALAEAPSSSSLQYTLVTNNHVITDCTSGGDITLHIAGETGTFSAELVSYDTTNDLAILATDRYMPPLPLVTEAHASQVGYWVMAVGSPGAVGGLLEGRVTFGHVTDVQSDTVVTDASVNHGNSGGPLINAWGEVIAVNTYKPADTEIQNVTYSMQIRLLCDSLLICASMPSIG